MPDATPVFARRGASLGLTVTGGALWVGAAALALSAFLTIDGSEGKLSLAVVAVVAGATCLLLAVFASIRRARRLHRVPVGALLLAPVILAIAGYGVYLATAELREVRQTPGAFNVHYLSGDTQIGLVSGSGAWWVRLDACPGRGPYESAVVQKGTGFADVTYGGPTRGGPRCGCTSPSGAPSASARPARRPCPTGCT